MSRLKERGQKRGFSASNVQCEIYHPHPTLMHVCVCVDHVNLFSLFEGL